MKKYERLLDKLMEMTDRGYNFSYRENPLGQVTFRSADMTIFAQYFHNTDFKEWFKYFVLQWGIKDILSVEKTKYGCLIVEVI